MNNSIFNIEYPANEPIYNYKPCSLERRELIVALKQLSSEITEVPIIIGGKEIFTKDKGEIIMPHDYNHKLGTYNKAGEPEISKAIEVALATQHYWANLSWVERISISLKIAELISGKYRYLLNAATMLGQSKNIFQSEIDAVCETIDFIKFNAYYLNQIYKGQPHNSPATINRLEYRPLEGFVFAISPFNFTSIAANLALAPALMGNTVIWKPSTTSLLSNYLLMKIFKEAGLPDGVINFIPGSGATIGNIVLTNPNLSGVHFTGSTNTFNNIWQTVANNLSKYRSYPRLVGETGGKDFVFVHNSANISEVATALIRGAFENQGQKCSAPSRAYIPKSLWSDIYNQLSIMISEIKMGDVRDFSNFINAVIDEKAWNKIVSYINYAKESSDCEIIFGGNANKSKGYFIEPTIVKTTNPKSKLMIEEIFGPVLTVYIYEDDKYEETLDLCNNTSDYALTGAVFAVSRTAIETATMKLKYAAGNFYINDKPTGAVVGQQPFGGSRKSGTNDKAGSYLNLLRWTSPRTIKENLLPPSDYKYPFMHYDNCSESNSLLK